MLPVVRGLEREYAGRIEFVRVNVLDASNAPIMNQFGFSATPELYLVDRDGKILRSWDEAVGAGDLRSAFDFALR